MVRFVVIEIYRNKIVLQDIAFEVITILKLIPNDRFSYILFNSSSIIIII